MQVSFYGAVREVTGSMHLLSTERDRILLDCGMFQGRRRETRDKNTVMPFDPRILTNVVLSHAHIDHSGRLPLLVKNDFAGRIISTRATAAACEYLLPDSAHIQESDAQYLNYKMVRSALQKMERSKKKGKKQIRSLKKNKHQLNVDRINDLIDSLDLEGVTPLYSAEDAEEALTRFDGNPYRYPVTIGDGITCTFYDAGHILGSAISIIRARDNGRNYTIGFTGDIGRFDKPILEDPTLEFDEADRELDLLIMESTYGDRQHEPVVNLKPRLKQVLVDTYDRGGTIMIPSFAFGAEPRSFFMFCTNSTRKVTFPIFRCSSTVPWPLILRGYSSNIPKPTTRKPMRPFSSRVKIHFSSRRSVSWVQFKNLLRSIRIKPPISWCPHPVCVRRAAFCITCGIKYTIPGIRC